MAKEIAFLHPEIERLDRDDMRALQAKKLAALGARLAERADWVAHFKRAGLHPRGLRDHASLAAVPTLEKSDLRQRYPYPFLTVPLESVTRFFATSGTTGLPVLFGFTKRDLELVGRQVARQ